jgi:GR25 family glycosyltransferase involved in LPS biosynthesis
MLVNLQPKTYVISLRDQTQLSAQGQRNRDLAEQYLDLTLSTLAQQAWHYSLWPARDGHQLTPEDWAAQGITVYPKSKIARHPGALGCLYSHLELWRLCMAMGEPIVILEHDVLIKRPWQAVSIENAVVKLGTLFRTTRASEGVGDWEPGAWAYLIDPSAAQTMIAYLQTHGAIVVDKLIGSRVVNWLYCDPQMVTLNVSSLAQSSTNGKNERRR